MIGRIAYGASSIFPGNANYLQGSNYRYVRNFDYSTMEESKILDICFSGTGFI
jgi:hypothetical protein